MTAISGRLPPVVIEYTLKSTGERIRKKYDSAVVARGVYAKLLADGRDPKVLSAMDKPNK